MTLSLNKEKLRELYKHVMKKMTKKINCSTFDQHFSNLRTETHMKSGLVWGHIVFKSLETLKPY